MARNVYITMGAADDGAALNANESTKPVDMTNIANGDFGAAGTFGGGTLTLEVDLGDGNWRSSGLTLNAAGKVSLTTPCKKARWTLSGATAPSISTCCALRTLD